MKTILRMLPDALATAGAICIVVALWLVSPIAGLLALGAALLIGAMLVARFGGGDA